MFQVVKSDSKDGAQFGPPFFQMLDWDLMPFFKEEFSGFQSPDKSDGQDVNKGFNPLQVGQVGFFRIEPPLFAGTEKDLDAHLWAYGWVGTSLMRMRYSFEETLWPPTQSRA